MITRQRFVPEQFNTTANEDFLWGTQVPVELLSTRMRYSYLPPLVPAMFRRTGCLSLLIGANRPHTPAEAALGPRELVQSQTLLSRAQGPAGLTGEVWRDPWQPAFR